MQAEVIPVTLNTVIGECAKTKAEGYRLVTLSCTALPDGNYDILYHFDKDLKLKHLRLTVAGNAVVPSISSVYFSAFLVENEIQDLFGLRFSGLAIDYKRTLYLEKEVKTTPFCRYVVGKGDRKTDSGS